jgi:alkylation response protein AidB-like acyl-CoA dehydrogenase
MFAFDVDDELEIQIEVTRKLAAEKLLPALREAEQRRAVDDSVRDAFVEVGLAGLEIPESLGGAGLGPLSRVFLNEELAAADAGSALALDPLGPALYPILELGGESALAELEAACEVRPGSRSVLLCEAEDRGTAGSLSLDAAWVPADDVAAVVALGPQGACWVTDGIATEPVRGAGLRAAGASRLALDGAPLRGAWRDPKGAARAWARSRLYVASLLLGVMRTACEFSRAYAQEREAFGRPIAHHQALAFLIIDMNMALEGARLLVREAAWRAERGLPVAGEAAAALVECIEAARFIGPNGVQILGGHGFVQDYPVEKHMREARALGLLAGGLDLAVQEAGRHLCDRDQPLALAHLASGDV